MILATVSNERSFTSTQRVHLRMVGRLFESPASYRKVACLEQERKICGIVGGLSICESSVCVAGTNPTKT